VETQAQRFEHGGATLVDEISGSARDSRNRHMVFLHGWGANRESLRGIATLFQRTDTVHLIDLPGFGAAPLPPDGWSTIDYADLVQAYLAERISGPVILVGHSFGARVIVRLAARRLPGIHAIVLMAAPGLPASPLSRPSLRRRGIRTLRMLLKLARGLTGAGPLAWHTRRFGSKDYLTAGNMRDVLVRVVNEDLTDSAQDVACPALLLWGSDDRETPPWLAYRYLELMNSHGTRATLEMLPHKDHFLYSGTGAHLCAFKIRAWLNVIDGVTDHAR
jgi:pimeloyl-ACP methyl ester carboxylesterase